MAERIGTMRRAVERSWWLPVATWITVLLIPAALLYQSLWAARRLLFERGLFKIERVPLPVVVIGNLIVGGAGKTPAVMALVQALRRDGWTPGVVSRGYGAQATTARAITPHTPAADGGDEPLLIHLRTGAPVYVARRRIDAARALIAAHPEVDIVLADDGLQHLGLNRDAQVIVFDERGVGNGRLLPAGPLREPLTPRPPPRSVVLYNAPAASTRWAGFIARRRLAGAVPLADWWAGRPPVDGSLQALRGRPVLAAAGLAAPEKFFRMLEAQGLTIRRLPLADHARLEPRPWQSDEAIVLVTEKDAVKLPADARDAAAIHVVTLDFELPEAALAALRALLPTPPCAKPTKPP